MWKHVGKKHDGSLRPQKLQIKHVSEFRYTAWSKSLLTDFKNESTHSGVLLFCWGAWGLLPPRRLLLSQFTLEPGIGTVQSTWLRSLKNQQFRQSTTHTQVSTGTQSSLFSTSVIFSNKCFSVSSVMGRTSFMGHLVFSLLLRISHHENLLLTFFSVVTGLCYFLFFMLFF